MKKPDKFLIGWQEWVNLNELGLPLIKAKVDTGAKTSALHAINQKVQIEKGEKFVYFTVHPLVHRPQVKVLCKALLIDYRKVISSNGSYEYRNVIKTNLQLADKVWPIEITLSNRKSLRFKMLLGREALRDKILIDPSKTLLIKNFTKTEINSYYS